MFHFITNLTANGNITCYRLKSFEQIQKFYISQIFFKVYAKWANVFHPNSISHKNWPEITRHVFMLKLCAFFISLEFCCCLKSLWFSTCLKSTLYYWRKKYSKSTNSTNIFRKGVKTSYEIKWKDWVVIKRVEKIMNWKENCKSWGLFITKKGLHI